MVSSLGRLEQLADARELGRRLVRTLDHLPETTGIDFVDDEEQEPFVLLLQLLLRG